MIKISYKVLLGDFDRFDEAMEENRRDTIEYS